MTIVVRRVFPFLAENNGGSCEEFIKHFTLLNVSSRFVFKIKRHFLIVPEVNYYSIYLPVFSQGQLSSNKTTRRGLRLIRDLYNLEKLLNE